MQYFDIYVDGMKELYTYSDINDEFSEGDFVLVPFRNIKKSALIIRRNMNESFDFKILNISSGIKNSIKLNKNQLKLIEWLVNYYLSSYDSVVKTLIPKNLKIKYKQNYCLNLYESDFSLHRNNKILNFILNLAKISYSTAKTKFKKSVIDKLLQDKYLNLNCNKLEISIDKFLSLEYENKEVFDYFYNKTIIRKENLEKVFSKIEIKKVVDMGFLKIKTDLDEKKEFLKENLKNINRKNSILTKEQDFVRKEIEESEQRYFLLKGVTGSGKTEVYIELIKRAFFKGEGSIFLVPEISLTPQMIAKFKNEFKNNIAILHSRLTDNQRAKEWESIYSGEKKIVLGVRSAIFSPVKNLKYIILDEEHEATYKQDMNPRYHAKYVAIKRCLTENAKLILGSASPSIESYYYAQKGIYKLLNMDLRYGNAKIPSIEIVDMKKEEDIFFSKKLLKEIRESLKREEQIILLLNRKGYSTYIQCRDCGHVEECENCSIKMSYYNGIKKLKCNYCGKVKNYSGKCSKCGSKNLVHSGKGIERVEEELKKYFDVPIIKADGDYSKDRNFFENLYNDFLDKRYSILIGTQIVAKGLHFPNVTLVGVINADIILNFPDFRAGEKTFQLLTQVSGRAGRAEKEGKVIIQTYQDESYVIENSREEKYINFYKKEIELRKMFFYPPFSKIINIGLSSENEEKLKEEAKHIFEAIKNEKIEIYGPMPSMVYKVKRRYRMNIFIKGKKNDIDDFKKELRKKIKSFEKSDLRIVIDIDPINLF
ncbi:MAG: primosomal protein N' [Fusobacterium sp.]|uniref:replication restart helicase PriA n=1 Tax=Fusobacterium sp. TaxID=68766 RepID=UPI0026DC14C8|nr:primosomal protein N' [Fusobacterium sp.]MDO4689768.1 primosomal protein N' [Fusobacterium sp.]